MMIGSSIRGVAKSSSLAITTTSGINDEPSTSMMAPSTRARQPVPCTAWARAAWVCS
jgi:hypothetical protein